MTGGEAVKESAPEADSRFRADCERCVGLCCVASEFAASADFAIAKRAGSPCPHLAADHRCSIHDQLRNRGFAGCAVFDCFGAGQHISQITYANVDWRNSPPPVAKEMFESFRIMRHLYELLWHLHEARRWCDPLEPLGVEVERQFAEIDRATRNSPDDLRRIDILATRRAVGESLTQLSAAVRQAASAKLASFRNADLVGKNLAGRDLRRADLVGALLLGCNLQGADLTGADVRGADFRAANLRDARLVDCLFLSQPQLDAAIGNAGTRLPSNRRRPQHWE
jgi:uncharacterized protein YjbI with pentapeptide repeats